MRKPFETATAKRLPGLSEQRALIGVLSVVVALFGPCLSAEAVVKPTEASLGHARASFRPDVLMVSTGSVVRQWQWTGHGWVTVGLTDLQTNRRYVQKAPTYTCDWELPGAVTRDSRAELLSVDIVESDDDGFSSGHLQVVSTIHYPQSKLAIRHVVWVYPDAPGIRTQLQVKALPGFTPSEKMRVADEVYKSYGGTLIRAGARTDYLPLDLSQPNRRRYWGYYNDPGNRHPLNKDMLKEQVVTGHPVFQNETTTWASAVAVEYGDNGVVLVKESPKTVNQPAYLTGAFFLNPAGASVTGPGLAPQETVPDRFRECWATWTLLYRGGNDGMQLALKRFDAARYPVFPKRDMFIMGNTWGPADPGGRQFAQEDFVLKEIEALGRLGVDVLQIDDGWQQSGGGPGAKRFLPHYESGWNKVRDALQKAGVRVGLWVAIRNVSSADLKRNLDELGFISYKADYDRLQNRSDYEQRIQQLRDILKHSWMNTQFTLCPEYDDPRYGWYFMRDLGSNYFQNNQEGLPVHLTTVPFHVLRKKWQVAKYLPANKLQVLLQNPKRTRRDVSDAYLHSHGYCFAMGMPFVPIFFQSAQYLDKDGFQELKALIAVFKQHREAIFTGFTFPIGTEPDNANWAGFQIVGRQLDDGYLLLFRELHNQQADKDVRLKFLAGKTIKLTNVQTGTYREVIVSKEGEVSFSIASPADFLFLKYEILH